MFRHRMRMPRLPHKFVADGVWVTLSQATSALAGVAGLKFLTQVVNPGVFGSLGLLMGGTSLLSSLFCTPYIQAAIRFAPEAALSGHSANLRGTIASILRKSTAKLLILVVFIGGIYSVMYRSSWLLLVAVLGLMVTDIYRAVETGLLSAERKQREAGLWVMLDACARPACALTAVAAFGPTTVAITIGYLAASILSLLIFVWQLKLPSLLVPSAVLEGDLERRLKLYAAPLIPVAVVGWLCSLSDRYLIGGIVGLGEVGLYTAAYSIISRPFLMLSGVALTCARPIYFAAVSSGQDKRASELTRMWLLTVSTCFVAGCIIVFCFSRHIADLVLGTQYARAAEFMPMIAVGSSFLYLSHIFNSISLAYKKTMYVLASESTGAAIGVGLGAALTIKFGAKGAAIAMMIQFGAQMLLAWALSVKARAASSTHL